MPWWNRVSDRAGILAEFIKFLWERKLWWMIPMIVVLVLFGAVLILTQSSAIAPFIYSL
ncbi:MAG: hypothetical protein HY268_33040, partial [Deltaproteobacteria bacterium]|nr:hypothetical protein [Deltaproteobacteria bacterium]